jgi:catechol 2,3-dioxygenase-like lactoylglutathione lyase family enzyme
MNAFVTKFLHVTITVPNLEKAVMFYCGALGFASIFETSTDKADGKLLGFEEEEIGINALHILPPGANHNQATKINLIEYTNPPTIADDGPYSAMNHVGITRLALVVEDVHDAFESIRGIEGVEIICAPKESVIREASVTFTSTWFSFKDPFGVFFTITQSPVF